MTATDRSAKARASNIECVLPLTPVQEGMLFHCLENPGGALYVEQYLCLVKGPVQNDHFRAAWEETVATHTAMRALFVWEKTERPVQIIRGKVELPWRSLDWSHLNADEQSVRLDALLGSDQAEGFVLDQAPLMRVTLIRLGPGLHRMLWTNHHLLMDGWSTPRVLKEVLERYYELSTGQRQDRTPPPPLAPYLEWVLNQDLTQAETFWRQTLSGFHEPNILRPPANDQAHQQHFTLGHGRARLQLSAETTTRLVRFAKNNGLTTSTLFYAAWALLVGVYSQRRDVVLGMTVSGRSAGPEGIEQVVGLFLNTIPLRVNLDPNQNTLDWLRQVQTQQFEAMGYEQCPLAEIRSWCDVPAGQGLFESLAVFENFPDSGEALRGRGDVQLGDIESREHTNYPISAIATPGRALRLLIVHDRARLDDAGAERMVRQLGALLSALPDASEHTLLRLDPLPAEERRQLLAMSISPWPQPAPLADILATIRARADQFPEATAVTCGSQRLDYRRLLARAGGLARQLQSKRIGPGHYVGICLERGVELPMAALGVMMSGAAYVPLDPTYPRERLATVLSELAQSSGKPAPLVAQKGLSIEGLAPDSAVIDIDEVESDGPPLAPAQIASQDPAYVIFTSGSTGTPKGVVVSRANLTASTAARFGYYSERAPRCFLLTSSFAFDSAVAGLYWTLTCGGKLVLLPPGSAPDIALLANLIERERVTHTLMLPSLYRLLLENADPKQLSSLAVVIVAGESCPNELPALHSARLPGVELHNEYGPTEATVWCSAERLDRPSNETPLTVGRPIPGARIYVLDQTRRLLPIGVPGEIAVAGAGVARGYLNNSVEDAARFVAEPFADQERMYLTGDRGYVDAQGKICFLGRIDDQIKVRGHRVEPTEIESWLRRHPKIKDAAVVLANQSTLVGILVPADSAEPDTAAVASWLGDHLPAHMIPGRWHVATVLPTTVTGKLDRRALTVQAEEQQPQPAGHSTASGPGTENQEILTRIIARVLDLESVGIEDNFFELGGDSIKSIRVAAEARRSGLSISAHDLFSHQTAAALAGVAQSVQNAEATSLDRPREAPLSPIQVWFHELALAQPNHWNQSFVVDVAASLSKTDIESALRALVAGHDALNVRFRMPGPDRDGQQLLGQNVPKVLEFSLFTLSPDLAASAEDEALQGLQRQLNPSRGVVLAAAAFDLGSSHARLVLSAHHLCVDVLSWPLLLRDLDYLLAKPSAAETGERPGSFLGRAQALTREAATQKTLSELDYWLEQVEANTAGLPIDTNEGADDEASARLLVTELSPGEAPVLSNKGASIAIVLLGALARTLAKWMDCKSVTVLMEGHGREPIADGRDVDTTVGWFTSLFPLRIDLPEIDVDPQKALQCAQEAWHRLPRGGLGYGLLRYLTPDTAVRARLGRHDLPPVLFNYLGWVGDETPVGQLLGAVRHCPNHERNPQNRRPHPLEVSAWTGPNGICLNWRYSSNRHHQATIDGLAQEMRATLIAMGGPAIDRAADASPDLGEDLGLDEGGLDKLLTQLPD